MHINFILSFDYVEEIIVIDVNEFVSKLGIALQNFCSEMCSHSFKRKTNEKYEIIYRSLLTCNDASSVLQLNHKSHEKFSKLSFAEKLFSILESEDNNDAAIWSNGEYGIVSHL